MRSEDCLLVRSSRRELNPQLLGTGVAELVRNPKEICDNLHVHVQGAVLVNLSINDCIFNQLKQGSLLVKEANTQACRFELQCS